MTTAPKNEMKVLSFEDIQAADDRIEETVKCPEWGGTVVVRGISKRQQRDIRMQARDAAGDIDSEVLEKLLFVNGVSEPLIDEDQYNILQDKSAAVIDRITSAVLRVSGMDDEANKRAERDFRS